MDKKLEGIGAKSKTKGKVKCEISSKPDMDKKLEGIGAKSKN